MTLDEIDPQKSNLAFCAWQSLAERQWLRISGLALAHAIPEVLDDAKLFVREVDIREFRQWGPSWLIRLFDRWLGRYRRGGRQDAVDIANYCIDGHPVDISPRYPRCNFSGYSDMIVANPGSAYNQIIKSVRPI